jgi:hypothetical protein
VPDPQTGYGGPLVLLEGNSFFLSMVVFVVLTAAMLALRARPPRRSADPSRMSDPASRMAA